MGRNQVLSGLLVAGCCLLAVGCDSSEKPKPADPPENTGTDNTEAENNHAAGTESASATSASGTEEAPFTTTKEDAKNQPVTVTMATPAELSQAIQKRKGQVVLVDFWATWCIPCIQNFPHSVEWHKEYGDQGLAVISVSMDGLLPEEHQAVLEFLKKQNATFTNFHSSLGGEEEAMLAFGVEGGAIPYYQIYDKNGNIAKTFGIDPDNPFGPQDIEAAIKAALGLE